MILRFLEAKKSCDPEALKPVSVGVPWHACPTNLLAESGFL